MYTCTYYTPAQVWLIWTFGWYLQLQSSSKDSLCVQRHFDFDLHCPPITCPNTARENSMDNHIIVLVDIVNLLLFCTPVGEKRRYIIVVHPWKIPPCITGGSRFRFDLLSMHQLTHLFCFPMQFKFHSYVCIAMSRPSRAKWLAFQRRKMRQNLSRSRQISAWWFLTECTLTLVLSDRSRQRWK